MKKILFIYTLSFFVLSSCSKSEIGPQCVSCEKTTIINSSSDLLIINEGTFNFGNASVSKYNPTQKTIANNLFYQANSSNLGDVAQSFTQIGNKGYIVVNNSGTIEVVNIADFKQIATISGLNSPRYLLPINNSKAYLTDLYANAITIINLTNNLISGTIPVAGWTENILLHNDTVYVCDRTNNNLLIINPNTDLLIDSVKLGIDPNSMIKDSDNKLWILCSGGFGVDFPKLIKFNPQNRNIEKTFIFSNINDSPNNLTINSLTHDLWFINNSIYTMNTASTNLPSTPYISDNNNTFYTLGIDTSLNELYVSDAIDYVQNGVVFRYDYQGNLIDQFSTGVIPSYFYFLK